MNKSQNKNGIAFIKKWEMVVQTQEIRNIKSGCEEGAIINLEKKIIIWNKMP